MTFFSPRDQLQGVRATSEWVSSVDVPADEGAAFARLTEALQDLQDQIAGARPTVVASGRAVKLLTAAGRLMDEHRVEEDRQFAGRLFDVPGRAQSFLPRHVVDRSGAGTVSGRVTFGRVHLGGNGAAHGGSLPLFFDEVFGWFAASTEDRLRTAYLHVDYRAITPIGRELSFEVRLHQRAGRKTVVRGSLNDGAVRLAEAEGLFVRLLRGQP